MARVFTVWTEGVRKLRQTFQTKRDIDCTPPRALELDIVCADLGKLSTLHGHYGLWLWKNVQYGPCGALHPCRKVKG